MQNKSILFSLFFTVFSTACSDKKTPVRQLALSCEISYEDKKIKQLKQPDIRSTEYGFINNNVALSYNEKHERGVVLLNDSILQRLKISKDQFSKLSEVTKDGSSIAQLEYNKKFPLKVPLFIVAEDTNQFLFYKIHSLIKIKLSEIDEAEEDSYVEQRTKGKLLAAGALGFGGGLVVGGMAATFILLFYKLKQLFYA